MSSGEGGKAQSSPAANDRTEGASQTPPAQEQTAPVDVDGARPTASDASQPGSTEIPLLRPATEGFTPQRSPFEIDDEETQAQPMSEAAQSQERSKGPCRAPGYKIIEPLGQGTYGEVWLAEEERTGVLVAIKFLAHGADERWQMLQAEVLQLAQLHADPGIVQLIDVEYDSKPPYYIMAYAKQGSLAQRLHKGTLPVDEALAIFRRVAEALAYVHARGICHCDLKPGNILLDARGMALVADFGQAHLSSDATPALGTFFYMAPEQANLHHSLPDTRWDVYGLGALMFAMLTGGPPRKDEALQAKLAAARSLEDRLDFYRESMQQSSPPAEHRKIRGVDRDLAALIDACLDVNPDQRPRNAAAVLAALQRRERKRRQRPAILFGLVTPIILMLVMVMLAAGVFVTAKERAYATQRDVEERVNDRNQFIAELVADDIDDRLGSYIKLVEDEARDPATLGVLQRADPKELGAFIKQWRHRAEHDKKPELLWITDANGIILKIHPHSVFPGHFQWRDWFNGEKDMPKDARAEPIQKTYISQPYLSTAKGRPMLIAITTPIRDPKEGNRVVGVLGVAIKLEDLERWVSRLDLKNSFAVVLNERGQYLSHQAKEEIKPKDDEEPRAVPAGFVFHPMRLPGHKPGMVAEPFVDPINGTKYVASYAPLTRNARWVVAIQREHEAVLQSIEEFNRSMLWIGVIAVIVLGILIPALWVWLIWMLRQGEEVADG